MKTYDLIRSDGQLYSDFCDQTVLNELSEAELNAYDRVLDVYVDMIKHKNFLDYLDDKITSDNF